MKTRFILLLVLIANLSFAQLSLTRPIQNSVIQRNNSNSATVAIAGQALSNTSLYSITVQYRVQQLSPQSGAYLSTPINWTSQTCAYGGTYNFTISLPGGWYQLDVKSSVTGGQQATVKFGVGEVFIIAGQSNAQGANTSLYSISPYDGVVSDSHQENTGCMTRIAPKYPSFSQLATNNQIAPNGNNSWCYTVLGNQLVDNTGVPVAFFNAAQQNTGVRNWYESLTNATTTNTYSGIVCGGGHPYKALKQSMLFYGSIFGVRSILWHQGENDAHDANANPPIQTGSGYSAQLRAVISQARTDFGHADLSWWISKVSYCNLPSPITGLYTNADILAAQGTVQSDSYNKVGPYTDPIGPRDVEHFKDLGIRDLGNAWYTSIGGSTLTSATPVSPNSVLSVSLLGSPSTGFYVGAISGFSQYYWFDPYGAGFDPSLPTSQYTPVAGGGSTWQCIALHSSGQWYISPIVYIPSTGGGARIGISDESENHLSFMVSPNPVEEQATIRFTLNVASQVDLTLVDATGKVIKQLVKGHHGEGNFSYPVDMTRLKPGIYFCNLIADDLHLTRKIVKQAK